MNTLIDNEYHVTVETNGSLPLEEIPNSEEIMISMDIKCPSSGMADRNLLDNLEFLSPRDQVKFVIADRVDYLFARKVLREHEVNAPVIFTPVGGTTLKPLAEWVLADKLLVRVMNQTAVTIVVDGVTGTVSWNGNVATFTPSAALAYDTSYSVTVSGKDLAGNDMGVTSGDVPPIEVRRATHLSTGRMVNTSLSMSPQKPLSS